MKLLNVSLEILLVLFLDSKRRRRSKNKTWIHGCEVRETAEQKEKQQWNVITKALCEDRIFG